MAKDKDELVLNPITGKLDTVRKFNENRIVTHERNLAGNTLMIYDQVSNTYIEMGFLTVTDNDGNVVVT